MIFDVDVSTELNELTNDLGGRRALHDGVMKCRSAVLYTAHTGDIHKPRNSLPFTLIYEIFESLFILSGAPISPETRQHGTSRGFSATVQLGEELDSGEDIASTT